MKARDGEPITLFRHRHGGRCMGAFSPHHALDVSGDDDDGDRRAVRPVQTGRHGQPAFYIAVAIGVSFAMLLMSGLMGLVFLSSASGHDEQVTDLATDDQAPTPRAIRI
jgi:hypothetical protein